ncbi:MAG: hypothetical protein RIM23_15620 [Coleofasciculus sp. G3-WIS-01]|uniref:hypothetical protein n=1 Tax=Coleofasciculus sp. G3-WIS-01 TaxID=3069528 RepID=UPI0032FEC4A4
MEEFKDKELFVELTPEELEELKGGSLPTLLGKLHPQPSITGPFLSKHFPGFPYGSPNPVLMPNIRNF